ncbi:hypothetical protein QUC31_009178 [Theobroma cacao]
MNGISEGLVFSLFLQSFLTFVVPFRMSTRKRPSIALIWCAYLIADAAANYAIGLITNSQRIQSNPSGLTEDNDLLAFWAPFLLLHLGCPDTITAFSLEDNELWLRHTLSLILQAVAALYVFIQSLTKNKLQVPTLLMLVTGVIKYAERIYALFLASLDRFRDSMLQKPDPGPDYARLMKKYTSMKEGNLPTRIIMVQEPEKEVKETKQGKLDDLEVVHYAYHFFETFKGLVVDLMFSIHARKESRDFFLAREPEDALRIIEVELTFINGVFYTKMKVMHSIVGYLFRFIAFGSVLAALGLFYFEAEENEYDPFNVKITCILLLGASLLSGGLGGTNVKVRACKLGVYLAKHNSRQTYWRRRDESLSSGSQDAQTGPRAQLNPILRGSAANSVRGSKSYLQAVTEGEPEQPDATLLPPPSPSGYKICSGFLENENLHWLERALVGVCKKYSEPEDVEKLMREDGRNGISIRRVVGCHDLIYFEIDYPGWSKWKEFDCASSSSSEFSSKENHPCPMEADDARDAGESQRTRGRGKAPMTNEEIIGPFATKVTMQPI